MGTLINCTNDIAVNSMCTNLGEHIACRLRTILMKNQDTFIKSLSYIYSQYHNIVSLYILPYTLAHRKVRLPCWNHVTVRMILMPSPFFLDIIKVIKVISFPWFFICFWNSMNCILATSFLETITFYKIYFRLNLIMPTN